MRPCRCIDKINKALRTQGMQLNLSFTFVGKNTIVRTIVETCHADVDMTKRGRRKKLPRMLATFCPFCGKAYPDPAKTIQGKVQ